MSNKVALIGGTGIGQLLAEMEGKTVVVPTPEGLLRTKLIKQNNKEIYLVQRHSVGHKTAPHMINYRAIALGLQKLGVKACLSTTAVGSLREDWKAGTMAVCSDFLDFTGRNPTLFDNSVSHTDFTHPFNQKVRLALFDTAKELGIDLKDKCTYTTTNGPRYETPAEIYMLRKLKGDVVGMTGATEAILIHEAKIPYVCLAIVTNLAAGMDAPELSHEEVVEVMLKSSKTAVKLLLNTLERI